MKYKNTRTNATITVSGVISGNGWEPVEEKTEEKKTEEKKTAKKKGSTK